MKIYIGIDPGASGALVWMDGKGSVIAHKVKDTPPVEAIKDAIGEHDTSDVVAVLEQVGGFMGGKDNKFLGSAMAKLGRSFGYWEGALAMAGVRCELVTPQRWQAGISGTSGKKGAERKRALRAEAIRRFPTVKVTMDNCDALLIADYCRMKNGGRE